jgi:hypothetical protein
MKVVDHRHEYGVVGNRLDDRIGKPTEPTPPMIIRHSCPCLRIQQHALERALLLRHESQAQSG